MSNQQVMEVMTMEEFIQMDHKHTRSLMNKAATDVLKEHHPDKTAEEIAILVERYIESFLSEYWPTFRG